MENKKQNEIQQQPVFNHKYGHLYDALGIDKNRASEIADMVKIAIAKATDEIPTSRKLEVILDNGLNFMEVVYATYLFGRLNGIKNEIANMTNNPFAGLFGLPKENISEDKIYQQLFDKINRNM